MATFHAAYTGLDWAPALAYSFGYAVPVSDNQHALLQQLACFEYAGPKGYPPQLVFPGMTMRAPAAPRLTAAAPKHLGEHVSHPQMHGQLLAPTLVPSYAQDHLNLERSLLQAHRGSANLPLRQAYPSDRVSAANPEALHKPWAAVHSQGGFGHTEPRETSVKLATTREPACPSPQELASLAARGASAAEYAAALSTLVIALAGDLQDNLPRRFSGTTGLQEILADLIVRDGAAGTSTFFHGLVVGQSLPDTSGHAPDHSRSLTGQETCKIFQHFASQVLSQTLMSPVSVILALYYIFRLPSLLKSSDASTRQRFDRIFARPASSFPFKLLVLGLMIANSECQPSEQHAAECLTIISCRAPR